MKSWYTIKNKSGEVIDISLHDEIGFFGVTAADFIGELQSNKKAKSINLSVHSYGGNLLDGLAMYNALVNHPAKVYARVEGAAASSATTVLMAGDFISMPENSWIMIHNPQGKVAGESSDMRELADLMDRFKGSIANILVKRTGKDRAEIDEMMNLKTFMSATQALEHGFIDTVTDKQEVQNLSMFSDAFDDFPVRPENKIDQVESIKTIKDYERFLRESGRVSRGLATALASRAKVIFQRDAGQPDPHQALEQISARLSRFKMP